MPVLCLMIIQKALCLISCLKLSEYSIWPTNASMGKTSLGHAIKQTCNSDIKEKNIMQYAYASHRRFSK